MEPKLRISVSQKRVLVISGIVVSTLSVLLLIFWISVGSVFQASAFESSKGALVAYETPEYWGIDSVPSVKEGASIAVKIWAKMDIFLVAKVLDQEGDILFREFIKVDKGSHYHRLDDLGTLPSGLYTLEVSGEDKSERQSILKP